MSDALQAALLERAKREKQRRQGPQADMSLMGRIKDNVWGVDDGVMSFGEKVATGLNNAAESLSFGVVGDEANAAFDDMIGRGDYASRRDLYRRNQEQFRDENPVASFASEVAPALIPGAGAAAIARQGVTRGAQAMRAGMQGAAAGGLYGFAEGEGGVGERVASGATGAVLGGFVGHAAPKIAQRASDGLKKMAGVSTKRPSIETLQRVKNQAYREVEELGEVFSPQEMAGLYRQVEGAFNAGHYVEEVDTASRAVLSVLNKRQAQPTTLSQLDGVRQNLWKRYASAPDQPQILDAIGAIDDLIDSRAGTSEAMQIARDANKKFAKTKLIEGLLQKADDQAASSGSGGNVANKTRQVFTRIANDPKMARFFDADEIKMMRAVIHPTMGESALRRLGKLGPGDSGLMLALHLAGASASGGATIPLMFAGGLAKGAADRGVQRKASQVLDRAAGFAPQAAPVPALGVGTSAAPLVEDVSSGLLEPWLLP